MNLCIFDISEFLFNDINFFVINLLLAYNIKEHNFGYKHL